MNNIFVTAIILAAGCGSRMGMDKTKQSINLCGKSVLWHTVSAFSNCDEVDAIIVVCRQDECAWAGEELSGFSKIVCIIPGGNTRAESAGIGFSSIPDKTDFVAIHDAARCLITPDNIQRVIFEAYKQGAATAATAVTDTLKSTDQGFIKSTLSRDGVYSAQTPQVFSKEIYSKALEAVDSDVTITDDNMLAERIGVKVSVVDTGKQNIKITTKDDLAYAEFILSRREKMSEIRVGHGYDVHRFAPQRKLVIGGVEIPFEMGLLGHSDADVLTHAVMDSLLGACGLGDIGRHFPDTCEEFKDISSLSLLRRVALIIKNEGFEVVNIDATLVMQKPKVAPYVESMVSNIANILEIERGRINIKATTEEHLGFTGRMEGVSAHSVALVKK